LEYVYICKDCNKEFTISGSFATLSSIEATCPDCKSKNVRKKFFATSSILNGDGFYRTDNRKPTYEVDE
jgi:putative FmdB family regulatory protein